MTAKKVWKRRILRPILTDLREGQLVDVVPRLQLDDQGRHVFEEELLKDSEVEAIEAVRAQLLRNLERMFPSMGNDTEDDDEEAADVDDVDGPAEAPNEVASRDGFTFADDEQRSSQVVIPGVVFSKP